jgi:quinol monooxygenase YgiN
MKTYYKEPLGGIALVGRMFARPGKREELLRFLEEVTAAAPGLEGVSAPLTVIFHTSPANPDIVVLYEHYASRALFEEHVANHERIPEYRAFGARGSELQAQPIEIVEVARPVARFTRSDSVLREGSSSGFARVEAAGVGLLARFVAKEGRRPELLELLEESVVPQAEFEGDPALEIVLHTSSQNPNLVVMYKHYPSRGSMEEHRSLQQIPVRSEQGARFTALLAAPAEFIEDATPIARFTRAAGEEEK